MPGAVVTDNDNSAVDMFEQTRILLDSACLSTVTALLDRLAITHRPYFVTCHVIVHSMQRRCQDRYHALLLNWRYFWEERQAEDLVGRPLSTGKRSC